MKPPSGTLARDTANAGVSWAALAHQAEHVPELRWPSAPRTIRQMLTDGQLAGLWLGYHMPIRRRRWVLDPAGASDEATRRIAEDLGLSIMGQEQDQTPAAHGRFDRMLSRALKALPYGRYDFEFDGRVEPDGTWRFTLEPRPPWTVTRPAFDRNTGDLTGIEFPSRTGRSAGFIGTVEVPLDRLQSFVWGDDDTWHGTSILRPCFRHWLRKDGLLRIDVTKHERNGMGIPVTTAPERSTPQADAALAAIASNLRVGEDVGGSIPYGAKLELLGVKGTLPDTIASVRYDDEQMSKALASMVIDLAQTSNGSRGLGGTFADLLAMVHDGCAEWIAGTLTEQACALSVRFNEGEGAPVPRVVSTRDPDGDPSVEDLGRLVDAGLITPDPVLEDALRARNRLPERPEEDAPTGQSYGYDLDLGILLVDERRAQIGLGPLPNGEGQVRALPAPVAPAAQPAAARARHQAVATAGERELRRNSQPHEAAMDLDAIEATYTEVTDAMVSTVLDQRPEQIDAIRAQIEAADGDLEELARLTAPILGAGAMTTLLLRATREGRAQAAGELDFEPDLPEADSRARAEQRAAALAQVVADDFASVARRRAILLTGDGGLDAEQVADQVVEHVEALSDAYLRRELGGAVHASQHAGRVDVIRQAVEVLDTVRIYASELLDAATCSPCVTVDGTEYDNLDDALEDYPAGGYAQCEGGGNCRGTLVAVSERESEASVDVA